MTMVFVDQPGLCPGLLINFRIYTLSAVRSESWHNFLWFIYLIILLYVSDIFFYLQGLQVQCFERITPFFSLLFVIFSIPAPLKYKKIIFVLSRLFQAQFLFLPSHVLSARVSGSRQPNQTALQWAETRYCAALFFFTLHCPVQPYWAPFFTSLHCNSWYSTTWKYTVLFPITLCLF